MTASNEIVARLRKWSPYWDEAADRIEALDAEVAALVEDMGRLRERETYYLNRAEALEEGLRDARDEVGVYLDGCEWMVPPARCDRPAHQCCKAARTTLARIDALLGDRT